ncbi:methylmalonyl-CoA mutase family protein [Corynebacterium epidermidicanis]|uniref:Methylmalonyl-CoA mutase, N-terminal domain/subunit n=1 Tax=Corynebacterium epidermidicanis TaxID=1050174 RepID=A0A0G3GPV9_9CORY|nr:methylmalonyl-CoA mutase family protein [Corynebacterium epidermidicanis]AKK03169.1 methylmalonyl-CoA mutase, N-terminal domain/subunit [Corynebacterium epidermidicanis]
MTDRQSDAATTSLPAEFAANQQDWYRAVAKVFARVQKKDIADVPADVWTKLIRTTNDGIDVNPLYTRADEGAEVAAPGAFPFVRGGVAPSDGRIGWGVTESFDTADAAAANKEILAALNNGTSQIVLRAEADVDLKAVLNNVVLSAMPVRLAAGGATAAVADQLLQLTEGESGIQLELGAAPLTAQIDGSASASLAETIALAEAAAQRPGVRAVLVDAVSFANQGATDAEEIGFALAAGVEYLRELTTAGLSVEQALGQLSFRFATTDDQFGQIAKFRAARSLWARVAEELGFPEAGLAPQHALTAPEMFSQRDPWVNMLRVTVAAFAAGVGGASDVEVLPFDYAVAGGMPGVSRAFAKRIARNTNLLLLEESHLGYVVDPAGGSFYVERLTDDLADRSWQVFTEVEAAGGFTAAQHTIVEKLAASHEKVRADIASRRKQLTGINEFPNLGEKALPAELRVEPAGVRRWAAEFEALRNRSDAYLEEHGTRPIIGLVPIGPLAKHNIRTGFTTNLLASGGIEVLNPGQVAPGTEEFAAAAKASDIVVICGTDQEYAATGESVVKALRDAGAGEILLAGAPQTFAEAADQPDGYLNLKIDAAATLAELLTKLGA